MINNTKQRKQNNYENVNNPYKRGFMDRTLTRRAVATRVNPRGSDEKKKKTSNVPIVSFCPKWPRFVPFVLRMTFSSCVVSFCPSNKRLKFAETVYFCWDLELLTWLNACAVIAQFRIVEQNISLNCLIISHMCMN